MKRRLKINEKVVLMSDYAFNQAVSKRLIKDMIGFVLSTKVSVVTASIDKICADLYLLENNFQNSELHALKFLIGDLAGCYSLKVTSGDDVATISVIRM